MGAGRIIAGTLLSAILIAGAVTVPALEARQTQRVRQFTVTPAPNLDSIGSFTPASADPKLTALLDRTGVSSSNFRFTPADASAERNRSVTIAVRASKNRGAPVAAAVSSAPASNVALAPIAYNLGVSVGWKRFVVAGDVAKFDLSGQPGSQERVDVGVGYQGKRAAASVKATKTKPLDQRQQLAGDVPTYSLDMAGSFSLTRNIDLTAGLRYKSERERLPQLEDNRRDSQAVYVGTVFRF